MFLIGSDRHSVFKYISDNLHHYVCKTVVLILQIDIKSIVQSGIPKKLKNARHLKYVASIHTETNTNYLETGQQLGV